MLVLSTVTVKIIGALYKIPLTNLLGGVGMGYFMSAYGLFNPIYAMSVAGFPIAISKMVSKSLAQDKSIHPGSILKSGVRVFMGIGLVLCLLMIAFARPFAHMVDNDYSFYCIIAIAPAIIFAAGGAAFRGYYEGHQNMVPTGLSQAIEAVTKLVMGITLVVLCLDITKNRAPAAIMRLGAAVGILPGEFKDNLPMIAAAGIFGVTLGSFVSFVFLLITTLFQPRNTDKKYRGPAGGSIAANIIELAVPVCLGALMINITAIVDLMTIMNGLSKISHNSLEILYKSHHNIIPTTILQEEIPSFLYGTYTGLAMTIFNIVPALTIAIGTTALPIISTLNSARKQRELRIAVNSIIKVTGIFTLPAGVGIFVLSEPILSFFFASNPAEVAIAVPLLRVLGIAVVLVGFAAPITSILQGIGAVYMPAKLMALGGVCKLLLNHFLIAVPQVNIKAAPFSTLVCYCIIVVGGLYSIESYMQLNMNVAGLLAKPFFAAILCGATAFYSHSLLSAVWSSRLVVILSVGLGGAVYLAAILLMRVITREDLSLFKDGEKFSKILELKGLLG